VFQAEANLVRRQQQMDVIGRALAWAAVMALGVACRAGRAEEPAIPRCEYRRAECKIEDWLVAGPFAGRSGQPAIDTDLLAPFGGEAAAGAVAVRASGRARTVAGQSYVDLFYWFDLTLDRSAPVPAAYLATDIVAEEDGEAYLLLGADDATKVWLNGALVAQDQRAEFGYADPIRLVLRRGSNVLLVKNTNTNTDWVTTARLEPNVFAATSAATKLTHRVLRNDVVMPGQPLRLGVTGAAPNQVSFEFRRLGGGPPIAAKPDAEGCIRVPEGTLAGLYRAVMSLDGETYSELFCLGDPRLIGPPLLRRAARRATDASSVTIDLETLQRRMRILTAPEHWQPEDYEWSRKVAFTLGELETILAHLDRGEEAFRDTPGLHLRGFKSRIDDQVQHYRLFVPSSYARTGAGLPLAVVLPMLPSASRPFIESAFVARHVEAEEMAQWADRFGVGILWCGYHGMPYGYPCDFTHFDEVLEAVGRDYKLDPSRLYLLGMCSSGVTASMYAAAWPGRFAGVGYLDPIFHRRKNRPGPPTTGFEDFPAYRAWVDANDPVPALLRVRNLPVRIIYDGAEPGHGELIYSTEFVREAATTHFAVQFDREPKSLDHHMQAWSELLQWLSTQHRPEASSARSDAYPWRDAEVGPASRAFADRFVVIEGTGGSAGERAAMHRLAESFRARWLKSHYGECSIVQDVRAANAAVEGANWVLIGNPGINTAWKALGDALPVSVDAASIRADSHVWRGSSLAVQAIVADPHRVGRRIVLIGGPAIEAARFGTLDLAADGWFDYAVWQTEDGRPRLLAANRYGGVAATSKPMELPSTAAGPGDAAAESDFTP
jgi:hypothetical protein